ncbi:MAG: homocysteine S-methyltransferase family protein [bacterium]|nr:homocysteine S-methyltransferase family protein [bacterium]MDE0239929.1 homocysteine S-methyltransferase family protein [bacterium]MDE0415761.1 homocysteine S-methyltransferase family protein [bacterium]
MILDDKLRSGDTIILDGATGTEIARLGGAMNSAAWCGVANKTHPEIVRKVHEDYIEAGCDVVITNTFATCRHVLAGAGLADETVAINRRAVELAREAVDSVGPSRPVAVAGSMSTTHAWKEGTLQADPAYLPDGETEASNFVEMAETLAEAGVDVLVLEMMSDIDGAGRCAEAAVATGLPVWVGISCIDDDDGSLVGLRASKSRQKAELPALEEIIDALMERGGDVYGIMHSTADVTGPALECLASRWQGPVMAYPETLRTFDERTHYPTESLTPDEFARSCLAWLDSGVSIIGGCCGTTIDHIRALVRHMEERVTG